MLQKISKIILQHKIIAGIITILIVSGGYFGYRTFKSKKEETRYVLTTVEKGTLIVSVSGSGQVSSLDQIDIKPKVSGEITGVYINKDQGVKTREILFELDTKDAKEAIRDAEINLENANFTLEKLKRSNEGAKADLVKDYDDAFNTVSDLFNDLPEIMESLENMFLESSYGSDQADIDFYKHIVGTYTGQFPLLHEEENYFSRFRDKYDKVRKERLSITRFSPTETLENFLEKTYALIKEIAELTRSARDIVVLYKETLTNQSLIPPIPVSATDTQLTDLNNFTNSLTQQVTNLLSDIQTIDKQKETIEGYERDIQSQELTIEQKENALSDAKENFDYCFIRAPFGGVIAKINIKKGDTVSSATTLATLITHQKIAEISLNEIDVAKVKVSQKATLTFDALPEATLTGKVIEVDTIGTVSQGVVSYGVKIALDTEDERIKPGMSVTADVIIDAKTDVLVLPNSAVKSQTGTYYVELVEIPGEKKLEFLNNRTGVILSNSPKRQQIEIGISNDSLTEILSGLKEGDVVVSSTISSTQTTQTQGTQQFQIPGVGTQMRMR